MISVRHAPTKKENDRLIGLPATPGETNGDWLGRTRAKSGILLLGGSSLSHFRIRVAQSHLRQDMLPSFWSLAGILHDGMVDTVPLGRAGDVSDVPLSNGVESCPLASFDDPGWYPNIAVIDFGLEPAAIAEAIARVKAQRSIIDLPRLIVPWLAYVWGAGQRVNPLLESTGLASAAFVETVYALCDVELTPGLSSDATCPEAIWQTVKWWRAYYEQAGGAQRGILPAGTFATRQPAAAARDSNDARG
jgi:hypothetical protein